MKYILLALLMTSCGKLKVEAEIPNTEQTVEATIRIDIPYKEVAEFCDERYGIKTEDSESCFEDYRNFLQIEFKIDEDITAQLPTACATAYSTPEEISLCETELALLLK